ncbi:MAG: hypothetical protein JNL28_10005 [Planctomycetes bacterium]|nr:hypothetical protein [Planctomycetota bacterium]
MILELALLAAVGPLQAPPPAPDQPPISIEEEVLRNIKAQPLGKGTVADLALPDEFLKRMGDRVIRSSFEQQFRIVVPDPPPVSAMPDAQAQKPQKDASFQPPSAVNLPLVIGTIVLAGFLVYLFITARSRKKMPL